MPLRSAKRTALLLLLASLAPASADARHRHIKPQALASGPAQPPKTTRLVIRLPLRTDESQLKLEMRAGKFMQVDCNIARLGNNLLALDQRPFGNRFWSVDPNAQAVQTMMGCAHQGTTSMFVAGNAVTLPYDSQKAITIFAPAGFEVRYRILGTKDPEQTAKPS